jgi:hypothetical protein
LDHPGVVRVLDVIELEGHPALVLELIPGGRTLADRLAEGPLRDDEVDAIAEALFDAVASAHAHGLVHRDLKPANILLDAGRPRIADFGLAKALGELGSVATATGALLGTPAYMAPEQVQDPRSVDARADLFSLGAILYELLAGKRAFPGAPTEAMWRAAHGDVAPLGSNDPRAAAAAWALRPHADARPPEVAALRGAWRGERTVPAAEATWSPSLAPPCPEPDELLQRRHDPDIVDHLASCPACRVDLRLYREFTAPPPARWPVGRWALGFLLGGLGALGTMTAVMGSLGSLLMVGPFLLLLLLLPAVGGARLAHAIGRAREGQQSSLLGWYLAPVLVLAVGAIATARSQAATPERVGALAAQASHVALSTWTIGYAIGLGLAALPPVAQVVIARDGARDPGFEQLPVFVGVGGAAGLWLAEGSAAGLLAFATATTVSLLVALLPRDTAVPTSARRIVALGAVVLVAVTPVAARVEVLRRAVLTAGTPDDVWIPMVDGWSAAWALLAMGLGATALRPHPWRSLRALGGAGTLQLAALVLLAAAPTAWTVVQMRALGAAMMAAP